MRSAGGHGAALAQAGCRVRASRLNPSGLAFRLQECVVRTRTGGDAVVAARGPGIERLMLGFRWRVMRPGVYCLADIGQTWSNLVALDDMDRPFGPLGQLRVRVTLLHCSNWQHAVQRAAEETVASSQVACAASEAPSGRSRRSQRWARERDTARSTGEPEHTQAMVETVFDRAR